MSRVTGKPPKNAMQIYEAQRQADLARHPAQATPDYDADPMWGTQKDQTDVEVKHSPTHIPGFIKEDLPHPSLQQPDFGWTPNPQDAIVEEPYTVRIARKKAEKAAAAAAAAATKP